MTGRGIVDLLVDAIVESLLVDVLGDEGPKGSPTGNTQDAHSASVVQTAGQL